MTEEHIAHLHRRLDVLGLCVTMSELSADDAYFVKNAQAKLQEAMQARRDIDDLIQRYEQLKEEEAALVADVEMRLRLAEHQKAFLDALPPPAPRGVPRGAADTGLADIARAHKKGGSQQNTKHISHLSEEEFAAVPKYMKGRFTLAVLDKLVDAFNAALDAKYELLALPKSRLKDSQWKKVTTYRQQETPETKGLRFVTDGDLTVKGSALESSRTVSSFATIMRNCNRLREIRGPQRLVRYVVV